MKEFFIQLITANSGVSSKRFISLFAMVLFTVIVVCSLYGVNVPDLIIYSLAGIILGNGAMSIPYNKKGG